MKYLIAIIAGFFIGGLSHEGNGYIVGGVLGFLLIQLLNLKTQVKKLESKLANKKDKKKHAAPKDTVSTAIQEESIEIEKNATTALDAVTNNIVSEKLSDEQVNEDIESLRIDRELIKHMSPEHYPKDNNIDTHAADITSTDKQNNTKKAQPDSKPKARKIPPLKTEPSAIDLLFLKIKSIVIGYFTGGNSLVRMGMLVLFIGVAFLLKYVAERTVVPVEYRYIGVSLASLAMLILGWKLRHKRKGFALSLQGGGIGLLYLTLFAAMRIHHLLPAHLVLFLLVGIVLLSAVLAILADSMALAIIGMLGGFAAPILTSTGSGSHVQLFSYYLLLNIGVFAIAWFKSWRILNVVGFVATFGIGSLWGYKYYKPEFLASVEPFLILYFLLYTVIAILFALKQPPKLKGINDGTIIFGAPLVGFALQAGLMQDTQHGLAYSALALGVFYVLVAFIIKRMQKPYMQALIESFVALGIGFATLAIPLGFDGRVTSAMWVLEGSALLWVGIRQSRMLPRFSGYALAVFGAAAFFVESNPTTDLIPWLNANYIGTLIIAIATAFIGLYARAHASKLLNIESKVIPSFMLTAAVAWWLFGGMLEIHTYFHAIQLLLLEIFLMATTLALLVATNKTHFNLLNFLSLITSFIMLLTAFATIPSVNNASIQFWNVRFLGILVIALTHFYLSWYWSTKKRHKLSQIFTNISPVYIVTGLASWLMAFTLEIMFYYPAQQFVLIEMMMAISVSILILLYKWQKIINYKWAATVVTLLMLLPIVLMPKSSISLPAVFNIPFLGVLIYTLTHYVMAWYWQKKITAEHNYKLMISNILLGFAMVSWLIMGHHELSVYLHGSLWLNSSLIFVSISMMVWILLAHKVDWQSLHLVRYLYLPYLIFMTYYILSMGYQFHTAFGLLAWLFVALVNYWVLRVYDSKNAIVNVAAYHLFSLLLFSFIIVYEFVEMIKQLLGQDSIWLHSAAALMLTSITIVIFNLKTLQRWPFRTYFISYFKHGLGVLLITSWLLVVIMNITAPGDLSYISYLPVFNAIDTTGLIFILLAWKIINNPVISIPNEYKKHSLIALAITAFLLLNASMLRCFHYWYDVSYQLRPMFSSFIVQSGMSILWSLTAVVLMVLSAKKKWRIVWLVGLGLMIAVVIKLFLVDMSASGTVARIVAFLSVGLLLSLVGYFSPLPPDDKPKKNNEANNVAQLEEEG